MESSRGPRQEKNGDDMISAGELRAEMESLMSLRRRSMSRPAALDPDLPPGTPAISQASSRPSLTITTSSDPIQNGNEDGFAPKSPTAPSPAETGTLVRRKSSISSPSDPPPVASTSAAASTSTYSADVPLSAQSADLFWLPASLHPELAPQEFKAFIREQTKPENLARRVSSSGSSFAGRGAYSSGRVERRKSTLRGEYKPTSDDGVGDGEDGEHTKKALSDGNRRKSTSKILFEELTISDLQRLEQLAARAEAEGAQGENEGEHLGRFLRRSLSLNPADLAAAAAAAPFEAASSPSTPVIVPPPSQILRRSARTKIRKAGVTAEGPHRFGPSRRGRTASGGSSQSQLEVDQGIAEDEAGDRSVEEDDPANRKSTVSSGDDHQFIEVVPVEWTDEPASIVLTPPPPDTDDVPPVVRPPVDSSASITAPEPALAGVKEEEERALPAAPSPSSPDYDFATHHQPAASRPLYPAPVPVIQHQVPVQQLQQQPQQQNVAPPVATTAPPPAKEKKSGWARLGLARDDDKKRKGKSREPSFDESSLPTSTSTSTSTATLTSTSTSTKEGFFGSLFGGASKKQRHEESTQSAPAPVPQPQVQVQQIQQPPPTASGFLAPDGRYRHFYRLPIHVERAVYRLSHIKLANPRRPLYEQVLISNLMFWYLSVINKPSAAQREQQQHQHSPAPQPIPVPQPTVDSAGPGAMSPLQNGTAGGASGSHKRMGLTKPSEGKRRAEMPVRPAQYEVQNRQIDAEYQHHPLTGPTVPQAEATTTSTPKVTSSYHPNKHEKVFEVTSRSAAAAAYAAPSTARLTAGGQDDNGIGKVMMPTTAQFGSVAPRKRGDSLNSTSTGTSMWSSPAFVSAAVNGVSTPSTPTSAPQ